MRTASMVVGIVLGSVAAATAQPPSSPLTAAAKRQFEQVHGLVMRAADKVDEDIYAFKPTPEVRSFAGVLGHIADGNVLLCAAWVRCRCGTANAPADGGAAPEKVVEGVVMYYIARMVRDPGRRSPARRTVRRSCATSMFRPQTVAEHLGFVGFGLTASRDGRTVLFSRVDSSVDELVMVDDFR